ncbi:adenine/guanine phosphoribosyltransferase-like PRPP-binding protein [Rhizobium aethiopicum]|uniref:Adenine/guanine phosphoribosyltransferase-like PRPP-binding protein n=2 Tax=Rhizobium/Agrobacterium group TaxID=227290 RepID=A0A7W6MH90_9HYPH|nr:adenine/guanine phosphoribosyltransferase-like PRPP-binding protein [Rhizobium aethiopicum]MBB4578917.1 adenine/guanine phosphoribosyltransferase-like PRPP-binding protein [Rhizobium aethiopicum]
MTDVPEMAPHDFWQEIHPPGTFPDDREFTTFYVAALEDGRQLRLPIRVLADGDHALASLIVNQASFAVLDALADGLAEKIKPMGVDVIAGLPTLGLTLAAAVAQKLGHDRYVPLGTSRKFWYRDELSVPLSSITTPTQDKRLYIDPRMLPLLTGRRVALIDDVISSGASIVSGVDLLTATGIEPVVIGAAMLQSERWRDSLAAAGPQWIARIRGVFATPVLERNAEGRWQVSARPKR